MTYLILFQQMLPYRLGAKRLSTGDLNARALRHGLVPANAQPESPHPREGVEVPANPRHCMTRSLCVPRPLNTQKRIVVRTTVRKYNLNAIGRTEVRVQFPLRNGRG